MAGEGQRLSVRAGLLFALMIGAPQLCGALHAAEPAKTAPALMASLKAGDVALKVAPPRHSIIDQPLKVAISYTSKVNGAPGKAVAKFHNVDTGEVLTKTIDVELSAGKHTAEVVWDKTQTLPAGLYVTSVSIQDASGNTIASYDPDPKTVQSLMVVGGATRMIDVAAVTKMLEDFPVWQKELEEAEAKAIAAGADTNRQHLLITVLKEAEIRGKEQLRFKWYEVLEANHEFLGREVPLVKAELEKMTADPSLSPKRALAPRPAERYTIRDGYFFAGDQPVFLSGPCVFNFTLGELPMIRDLGFNVIQVSTGPSAVFPTSDQATGTPRIIDYNERIKTGDVKDVLDQCAKLGIKVDLGLTAHFMPKWFYEKHPDAKNNAPNFMMPYDIESPDARKLIENWYAVVMPEIANHPALNSIWIVNEPGYLNPNERNLVLFRQWLKDKYKTVDAMNKTWGTKLADFDAITAGKGRDYIPGGVTTSPANADWWWFSSERVTRHFEWMRDLVHKYDPTVFVSAKLFNATFNPGFKPPMRTNEEPVDDLMAYAGYDGGSYPFAKSYADFLRSLSPEKPIANLEYKFASPPQRARLDFWKEAIKGAGLIDWWCWHTKPAFSRAPSYSIALYAAALDKMDIQRLMPQVMAFSKFPRSPMVILYPDPVHGRMKSYWGVHDLTNNALTDLGYASDYATEKRVGMGRLKEYPIIVMPSADYIRDDTYASVTKFITDGGIAIVMGDVPAHDEMERARDASFFNPEGHGPQEIKVDGVTAQVFAQGKGKVYLLSKLPMDAKGEKLAPEASDVVSDFLKKVAETELPPLAVEIGPAEWRVPATNATQAEAPASKGGIENRTINWKDEQGKTSYITWLCNESLDYDAVVAPKYNFKVKDCVDLITGEKLDPKRIVMPPTTARLMEFTVAP